jgi:hypothetical protein
MPGVRRHTIAVNHIVINDYRVRSDVTRIVLAMYIRIDIVKIIRNMLFKTGSFRKSGTKSVRRIRLQ